MGRQVGCASREHHLGASVCTNTKTLPTHIHALRSHKLALTPKTPITISISFNEKVRSHPNLCSTCRGYRTDRVPAPSNTHKAQKASALSSADSKLAWF